MQFFKDLPIKYKLTVMLVVPLLAPLLFSVSQVLDRAHLMRELGVLQNISVLAVNINGLVHELQLERGFSAGFIGSQGQNFAARLSRQQLRTDQQVEELQSSLRQFNLTEVDSHIQQPLNRAMKQLTHLQEYRQIVDGIPLAVEETLDRYNGLNASFFVVMDQLIRLSPDAGISRLLAAYTSFLRGKDHEALVRALLSHAFSHDRFARDGFQRYLVVEAERSNYFESFDAFAGRQEREWVDTLVQGSAVDEVRRIQEYVVENDNEGNLGIDADHWFTVATEKINRLKQVEERLSAQLLKKTSRLHSEASLTVWLIALVGLVVMGVTGFLVYHMARRILRPLANLKEATDLMAKGDTNVQVSQDSHDEIGALTGAFGAMVENERRIIEQAQYIAQGHSLAEFTPRSEIDQLGLALQKMITQIRERGRDLLDSETRIKRIVDSAADGIISLGEEECIESYNKAAERMFGYEVQEVLGQELALLMPSPFREEHDGYLEDFGPSGGEKVLGMSREVMGRRKDGATFPLEFTVSEVQLMDRRIFTVIIRDISECKKAETERERLNKQLMHTSRRAGMADVATSVLHNVGNVLNSLNVSAGMVRQTIRRLSVDKISRTAMMIHEHTENLGTYLKEDPQGQQIPGYLTQLGKHLFHEQTLALREMEELNKHIEHIKEIVNAQQNMAKTGGILESIKPREIMEQAIAVNLASMMRHGVEIVREYNDLSEIIADRHQVLQVLINLISNAKYAITEKGEHPSRMSLSVSQPEGEEGNVIWRVTDTGKGIKPENLPRIFTQGFTTKKTGHGFGLHSAALSAKLMGGSLVVQSDGEGQGATFSLELPIKPEEKNVARGSLLVAGEE